jgi:hypothetical protein
MKKGKVGANASVIQSLSVEVDFSRSVQASVRAGKYNWADPDVSARNFPSRRSGKVSVPLLLIEFDRKTESMESGDVVIFFRERNLRPAGLPELLALGERHPHIQKKVSIAALGSEWRTPDGERMVPYLWGDSVRRDLYLTSWCGGWGPFCRFAAVCLSASPTMRSC